MDLNYKLHHINPLLTFLSLAIFASDLLIDLIQCWHLTSKLFGVVLGAFRLVKDTVIFGYFQLLMFFKEL